MRTTQLLGALGVLLALSTTGSPAQEQVDRDIQWQIRREATDNSQIMQTLQVLTDVYGPRLTGSPNLKGASDWVVTTTTSWGLKNAHLEPWNFGHPGWLNERLSVHVVSPVKDALVAEALAWTPGTNGPVTARTTALEVPARPTQATLTAFFEAERAKVKGTIVLVGKPEVMSVTIVPPAKRREDNDVRAQMAGGPSPFGGPQGPPPTPPKEVLTANQVAEQLDQFLVSSGAVGRVNDAGRDHGQIAPSTIGLSTSPRRSPPSSCVTRTTAGCGA